MAPIPKLKPAPAASFDEAAIRTHVEMLHGLADGIDGLLVTSAYYANPTGDSDAPGTVTHHPVGDVDGMIDAIMAHASTPNANVFTGLQVMRNGLARGSRGKETDIVALLGLVVDLDGDTGKAGDMPVEPNAVLETSTGNYQPFILFDRATSPAEAKPLRRQGWRHSGLPKERQRSSPSTTMSRTICRRRSTICPIPNRNGASEMTATDFINEKFASADFEASANDRLAANDNTSPIEPLRLLANLAASGALTDDERDAGEILHRLAKASHSELKGPATIN